jgi:hypothetical protein
VNIYRSNNHPPIHLFHKQIPFAKRPPRVMFVVGFASSLITLLRQNPKAALNNAHRSRTLG